MFLFTDILNLTAGSVVAPTVSTFTFGSTERKLQLT